VFAHSNIWAPSTQFVSVIRELRRRERRL